MCKIQKMDIKNKQNKTKCLCTSQSIAKKKDKEKTLKTVRNIKDISNNNRMTFLMC